MAWTRAASRTEPGLPSPGAPPPYRPEAPDARRFDDEAPFRSRDSRLREPPRRLGRLVLAAVLLLAAGGFLGLLLAVELLGDQPRRAGTVTAPPPTAVPNPLAATGADAPPPAAAIGPGGADQLRQQAERMQLSAEVLALRKAAQLEQARLEALAQQRAAAEASLAALQRQPAAAPMPVPEATAPRPAAVPRATARGNEPRATEGRVQLHYLAGSPAAQQAAEDAAATLRDAGMEGVELRPAPGVPGNRVVRYHRAEDASLAARLAGRLGRGWAVQDSRGYDPGGAARGLEIWLPDR